VVESGLSIYKALSSIPSTKNKDRKKKLKYIIVENNLKRTSSNNNLQLEGYRGFNHYHIEKWLLLSLLFFIFVLFTFCYSHLFLSFPTVPRCKKKKKKSQDLPYISINSVHLCCIFLLWNPLLPWESFISISKHSAIVRILK
jgi:hypothetical protein